MSLSYKLQVIHVITPAITGLVLLLILRCNWGELSHAATTLSGLGRQILHPPIRRTLDDVDGRSFPTSYTFYLDGGNFDKIELRHLIGWRFFFGLRSYLFPWNQASRTSPKTLQSRCGRVEQGGQSSVVHHFSVQSGDRLLDETVGQHGGPREPEISVLSNS